MHTLLGTTLGKYRLTAHLGRGGMADVYQAYQASLDRYVAVKVLQLRTSDTAQHAEFVTRFKREATAIARLRHPHIVQVYDFDAQDDCYYMVMEYIAGPTLKAELRERRVHHEPFPLATVARLLHDLASAVDYAHAHSMVHRDIKPANIMFSADHQVVLTDFGIARMLDATRHTAPDALTGTPAYMAPEQGHGAPGDARSDLYSLGIVLYELLTGRVPFDADTPIGLIMQHMHAPLPPPRSVRPDLTEPIEQVIQRALEKSPSARFDTAQAFAQAFATAAQVTITPGGPTATLVAETRPVAPADNTLTQTGPMPAAVAPATSPQTPPCPYRGLFAFRPADAPFFFGREEFTARLVAAVAHQPLTVVLGPSGSGKSSVVFAGLLPALAGQPQWRITDLRPGAQPLHALASALLTQLEPDLRETERLIETRRMASALTAGELNLYDVIDRILQKNEPGARVLLVIDQFEELYTLCREAETRKQFIDLLLEALDTRRGRATPALTAVLTLRADFLSQGLTHRPLADALQAGALILGPMTRAEITRAVANPAARQGVAFEPGLIERITADVGSEAGRLPLLEFALTALWDQQAHKQLTHAAYTAVGRVDGALASYAEAVYTALSPSEQVQARRVFVQLLRPGEGTEDTRRQAVRTELDARDWAIVQQLASARLVVTDRDPAGHETVEVVHEALLHSWARLREWMNADRSFRAWQERLRAARRQWEASARDDGALLRGAPLVEAESWRDQRGDDLGPAERAFLDAALALRAREHAEREAQSQRELEAAQKLAAAERRQADEHRRTAQQLQRRAIILTIALFAAGAFLVLAYLSNEQARRSADFAQSQLGEAVAQRGTAQAASTWALSQQGTAQAYSQFAEAQRATAQNEASIRGTAEARALAESAEAQKQARLANARELAAAALNDLERDPERGLLLALHAVGITYATDGFALPEAENALHQTLPAVHIRLTLSGHDAEVESAAFSPDGRFVATASDDQTVRLWDVATGTTVRTFTGHTDWIWDVTFSRDGKYLASASRDRTVRVWEVATGKLAFTLNGAGNDEVSVDFSPDGAYLAAACWDGLARVWDMQTGALAFTLTGHTRGVTGVAFSPDGTRLATASFDNTAKLWDLTVPETPVLITMTGHTNQVLNIAYSPDGTRIATASGDGTARVWDTESGQQLLTLTGHNQSVNAIAFSADGARLVTAGNDGTAKVWDAAAGRLLYTLPGHTGSVVDAQFSADGLSIVTASEDKTAKIWNATPGREDLLINAHDGARVWSVAFSPDGRQMATGGSDGTIRLWDSVTGAAQGVLNGHASTVYSAIYSPDGRYLASGSFDTSVKVWDLSTHTTLLTLVGHSDRVFDLAFSPVAPAPGVMRLASAGRDGQSFVWDISINGGVPDAQVRYTLHAHADIVQSVAFSPDGTRLLTTSWDDTATMWDMTQGTPVLTFNQGTDIMAGAFSPDGTHIALARRDGVITVWELAHPEKERLTLSGHTGLVSSVTFSPDGARLASASYDGVVKLWDARDGRELVTFGGPSGELTSVVYSAGTPAGTRLATTSWDGMVRLYIMPLDALLTLAKTRLTRPLTSAECRKYLHSETCPALP